MPVHFAKTQLEMHFLFRQKQKKRLFLRYVSRLFSLSASRLHFISPQLCPWITAFKTIDADIFACLFQISIKHAFDSYSVVFTIRSFFFANRVKSKRKKNSSTKWMIPMYLCDFLHYFFINFGFSFNFLLSFKFPCWRRRWRSLRIWQLNYFEIKFIFSRFRKEFNGNREIKLEQWDSIAQSHLQINVFVIVSR